MFDIESLFADADPVRGSSPFRVPTRRRPRTSTNRSVRARPRDSAHSTEPKCG